MVVCGDKSSSKVFLLNRIFVKHFIRNGFPVKEFRAHTKDPRNSQLLAYIQEDGYYVKRQGKIKRVTAQEFMKWLMEESEYKRPVDKWGDENATFYSHDDYVKGDIRKGYTLSLVLNEVYRTLGYEVAVIDIDLSSNSQSERKVVGEFVKSLSEKREILATPNGFHILISRSEYELFINLLNTKDIRTISNNIKVNGVLTKCDIFLTWNGVRYILVPTDGSVREELGGGILFNGEVKKGNEPIDIINLFEKVNALNNEDGFIDALISSIRVDKEGEQFDDIVKDVVGSGGYAKKGGLMEFCRSIGIDNLSKYDINVLCRAIERLGTVNNSGRREKILRFFFYYIATILVKNTSSYEEMKDKYETITIFTDEDKRKVYESLEKIYLDSQKLSLRTKQFIQYADRQKMQIAEKKISKELYEAIKNHIHNKDKYKFVREDQTVELSKNDTWQSAAVKFHKVGVRRYDSKTIVARCCYFTREEFRDSNFYTKRRIPDSLSSFYLLLPTPSFYVDGKYYDSFKLIPAGSTYYYDSVKRASLLFFKHKKTKEPYCLKFTDEGFEIENVREVDRPLFYEYYISIRDFYDFETTLMELDMDIVDKLVYEKEFAKKTIDDFVKYVFNYYTLNPNNDEYDDIVKKAIIASLFSDNGFILQLVGQSGVGKTTLAKALGIVANNGRPSPSYSLGDNPDENNYRIMERISRGYAIILDELPKKIDEKTQRFIFSVVTSEENDFRKKYQAESVTVTHPAKIITTSLKVVDWAADAHRRSMIFTIHNKADKEKPGTESVRQYFATLMTTTIFAKIAFFSIISGVKLEKEDYDFFYRVSSIPDSLKISVFKFFKSVGVGLNKVVDAFNNTNQSIFSIKDFYINILELLSSDDVKEFIKDEKNRDHFPILKDGYYKISFPDLIRLLYAKGAVKKEITDDYIYISNIREDAVRNHNPDPSKFKETFVNLKQGNVVGGIDFKVIAKKLTDISRNRDIIEKIEGITSIPTSFVEGYGISIAFYRDNDKHAKVKNHILIRFLDNVKSEDNNDAHKKADIQTKQVEQKALFSDEQLKETIKKQKEEPRTYLEFRLGETQEEQLLDHAPSKSLYWFEEDKYYDDFSNMMHDGEQYEPEPVEDDEVPF
ncbi:MAG: hypothetical protein QW255_05450 [Candidatus Bilamarchaeaceae archaeon]